MSALFNSARPRRDETASDELGAVHETVEIIMLSLGNNWGRDLGRSPYRLRFELNTGGTCPTMFTTAYDRARTLARAALPGTSIVAIIAGMPNAWSMPYSVTKYGPKRASAFNVLEDMGVSTKTPLSRWRGWPFSDRQQGENPCTHRAINVNWDEVDILLWINIAQDIGVMPVAPVLTTLIDCDRDVSVFAYDDRGMDITSLTPDEIAPLYRQFEGWLLDYDRARMADAFRKNN
jgi:Domain of unknown function (DUF3885)